MKTKILPLICATALVMSMTSCYVNKEYIGNTNPTTPMVKVKSKNNSFLFWGLLPIGSNELKATDYVEGQQNYMLQTHHSFVNGLLDAITFGIYAPTTTTYYLPYEKK